MRQVFFLSLLTITVISFSCGSALAETDAAAGGARYGSADDQTAGVSAKIARATKKKRKNNRGLAKVCPKIITNYDRVLWKSSSSSHIPGSDPRTGGCTFIYGLGSRAPGSGLSCISVYDSKGNQVSKLGRYAANDGSEYKERYYTGTGCSGQQSCSSVASAAFRNTKNTTLYLGLGKNTCLRVPTAIGRYGGV